MAVGIEIKLDINPVSQARLMKNLDALPERVYDKVIGSAANFAMTPVLKAAKQKVPVKQELLKKSLGKKRVKYKRSGVVMVLIGPRPGFKDPDTGANPVNYAHLVEDGTAAHQIPGGPGGLKIGPVTIKGTVDHPGAVAKPFLRPAIDENKNVVLSRYRQKVAKGVDKEVRKMPK